MKLGKTTIIKFSRLQNFGNFLECNKNIKTMIARLNEEISKYNVRKQHCSISGYPCTTPNSLAAYTILSMAFCCQRGKMEFVHKKTVDVHFDQSDSCLRDHNKGLIWLPTQLFQDWSDCPDRIP